MPSLHQIIFIALWIVICGYAAARGGPPERIVAVLFVIAAITSTVVETGGGRSFHAVEPGIMAIDTGMFVLLMGLAIVSTRFWPMAMASLQGALLLGHLMRLLDHGVLPAGYFIAVVMWSFPMLMLLGVGTWRHVRRRKVLGVDHDWVHQLPPAYRAGASLNARA